MNISKRIRERLKSTYLRGSISIRCKNLADTWSNIDRCSPPAFYDDDGHDIKTAVYSCILDPKMINICFTIHPDQSEDVIVPNLVEKYFRKIPKFLTIGMIKCGYDDYYIYGDWRKVAYPIIQQFRQQTYSEELKIILYMTMNIKNHLIIVMQYL